MNCPICKGSGLQDGLYGTVSCDSCHGNGIIPKRDSNGTFVAEIMEIKRTQVTANIAGVDVETAKRLGF